MGFPHRAPTKIPAPPVPPTVPKGLLCSMPYWILKGLCPRQGSSTLTVDTPLGTAHGTSDGSDAVRFAVKYGSANRWQPSAVVSTWQLPNGASNATALPLACPQLNADDSTFSEDCLSMLLYVPDSISTDSDAPTLMWIHGGSFTSGSATGPGLDGSALAAATNSIVAVVQYRLGASQLGFMAPSGATNLAVKDIITALQFLQTVVPSFGGAPSKITLAGQSAGANMIRAMLAIPSASSLFQSAILQSDPMDYGFLNTTSQQTLQTFFNEQIGCAATDTACLNALSIDDILVIRAHPARARQLPHHNTLDSTSPFPAVSKPVLLSNVRQGLRSPSMAYSLIPWIVHFMRKLWKLHSALRAQNGSLRLPSMPCHLVRMGLRPTCDPATSSRNRPGLALRDMDVRPELGCERGYGFLGVYVVGASYPTNDVVPFCTEEGVVCHQDDIEIVFGTVQNPNAAQSALVEEMQARYNAFLHTGDPNTGLYTTWKPATTDLVHTLNLGGTGEAIVGACNTSYWGDFVQYDYQVFNI
ncbi:Para-nitrobenzyl esterase [Grifola frondosa]|uniref:Carboxylic ester hydrolase n=1 Tax=Grifola frondosa TaxID=5627 RepID=A0A1C7LY81_GRIFR|nr:Para-nitrobenzyl esterase [Grifola frondosa]